MNLDIFHSGSNTALSFDQKIEIIKLLSFLSKKMHDKDPIRFSNTLKILEIIFHKDFSNPDNLLGDDKIIYTFGFFCDNLLWGTDNIEKPEGYSNLSEIKDKIFSYFTEESLPF